MSPPKRTLSEPEDDLAKKRPRTMGCYATLEDGEDDMYGDGKPSRPMKSACIAQQAQATPEPLPMGSHQRQYEASISAPYFVDENSTASAAHECSTLGWNKITNLRSASVMGIGKITNCFDGSVESLHSTHTLINQTRDRTSEVRISPFPERGKCESATIAKGLKRKEKEREEPVNLQSTDSMHPTTFNGTNQDWVGQSVLLQLSQDYEDIPVPPIAMSPHHYCNQQYVPNFDSWYEVPTNGESSLSNSTTNPLWGLDDEELDASLGRLDEYFVENPHLILTPADVAALPTSFNSTTFGAAQMLPHQHKGGTSDIPTGYSQPAQPDTTSPLSSPSSPSSLSPPITSSSSSVSIWNRYESHPSAPPSSASSRSRFHPMYRSSAPMGTVSEATVLWMVRNVPLPQVSSILPEVLSLPEPETQLSVLVLREARGRHRVTAAEVNEFETMVYNESVDERWRGRRYRQRKPRRRSHIRQSLSTL